MPLASQFLVEAGAGLVGVFAGVFLALMADHRRRAREEARERDRLAREHEEMRRAILGSVVKNTMEARRLRGLLAGEGDPYLFQVRFELAVWEATHASFVRLSSLDERIIFTRFFDQVRRLVSLLDFHRRTRAELELRATPADAGDQKLLADLVGGLGAAAEDARLDGVVLVTDFGEEEHKRLLGIQPAQPQAA